MTDDASDIAYTAIASGTYSCPKLDVNEIEHTVKPHEIKPDDFIKIDFRVVPRSDRCGITVMSRSITFKDLCTAIARQLVDNDLNIESDN